jgi:hypothetical protein
MKNLLTYEGATTSDEEAKTDDGRYGTGDGEAGRRWWRLELWQASGSGGVVCEAAL